MHWARLALWYGTSSGRSRRFLGSGIKVSKSRFLGKNRRFLEEAPVVKEDSRLTSGPLRRGRTWRTFLGEFALVNKWNAEFEHALKAGVAFSCSALLAGSCS